jgi:hypothetical protein
LKRESIDTVWAPIRQGSWPHRAEARRWQQLLGRLNLTISHLTFSAPFATKLAGDFQPCSGALNRQITFHFSQAGHDMKEETTGGRTRVDGIGETLELNALLV